MTRIEAADHPGDAQDAQEDAQEDAQDTQEDAQEDAQDTQEDAQDAQDAQAETPASTAVPVPSGTRHRMWARLGRQLAKRKKRVVAGCVAILMTSLMLSASLKDTIDPLPPEPPERWIISGADETLDTLLSHTNSPLVSHGTSITVHALLQPLDIEQTARLTLDENILWIEGGVDVQVYGTLIIRNSTILDDPLDEASTWRGLTIHPQGQLLIENALIEGGDPTIRILDPSDDMEQRVNITGLSLVPLGTGLAIDGRPADWDGASVTHAHADVFPGAPAALEVTATLVGLGDLTHRRIEWAMDGVVVEAAGTTLTRDFAAPAAAGVHVITSRVHPVDRDYVTLARGASLVIVSDDAETPGALTPGVHAAHVQPYDWSHLTGTPVHESVTWTSSAEIDSGDDDELDLRAFDDGGHRARGPHTITRDHVTESQHVQVIEWPDRPSGMQDQFVVSGSARDLWLTAWYDADPVTRGIGPMSDLEPRVLQGDPYRLDQDRVHLVEWAPSNRSVPSFDMSTGSAMPQQELPIEGWTGYTVCPTDVGGGVIAPVLHRFRDDGAGGIEASALKWNGGAWEARDESLGDLAAVGIDALRPFACLDTSTPVDGHDVFMQAVDDWVRASPRVPRLTLTHHPGVGEPAITNGTWPHLEVPAGVIFQHSFGRELAARLPYGLVPSVLKWTTFINTMTPDVYEPLAADGGDLPRIGGSPATIAEGFAIGHYDGDHISSTLELTGPTGSTPSPTSIATPYTYAAVTPLAACDLDRDGLRELIQVEEDGRFGVWEHSMGSWADEGVQGRLPLPRHMTDLTSIACLEATDAHSPRLVAVDFQGRVAVFSPPLHEYEVGGRLPTHDALDLTTWVHVASDQADPSERPLTGWFAHAPRLGHPLGAVALDLALPRFEQVRSTVWAPRYRAGPGSIDIDVEVSLASAVDNELVLTINGTELERIPVPALESVQHSIQFTTPDLAPGSHHVRLTVEHPRGPTTLFAATIRVITVEGWNDLQAGGAIRGVIIDAAETAPAIVVQGGSVELSDVRIASDLDAAPHDPLILLEDSDTVLTSVLLEDIPGVAIRATGGTASINGVTARNVSAEALDIRRAQVTADGWNISADPAWTADAGRPLRAIRAQDAVAVLTNISIVGVVTGLEDRSSHLTLRNVSFWEIETALSLSDRSSTGRVLLDNLTVDAVDTGHPSQALLRSSAADLVITGLQFDDTTFTGLPLSLRDGTVHATAVNISTGATVFHGYGRVTGSFRYSTWNGGPGSAVLQVEDSGHVQLLDMTLSGAAPEVWDSGQIETLARPVIHMWDPFASQDATIEVTIDSLSKDKTDLITVTLPVHSSPPEDQMLPRYAGVYASAPGDGVDLHLWSLHGDGTTSPRTSPERLDSMYILQWDSGSGPTSVIVPVTGHRPFVLATMGDADLDGWSDPAESQEGSKGVFRMESTGQDDGAVHDLTALDQLAYVIDGGPSTTATFVLGPPAAAEEHRVWFRWRYIAADPALDRFATHQPTGPCLAVTLSEPEPGSTPVSQPCVPVDATYRWTSGPIAQLDASDAARWIEVDVRWPAAPNDWSGSLVVDEVWLLRRGEIPMAAWINDLDGDALPDGLESPFMPGDLVTAGVDGFGEPAPITGPRLVSDKRGAFGWYVDMADPATAPVASPPAWRVGTTVMINAHQEEEVVGLEGRHCTSGGGCPGTWSEVMPDASPGWRALAWAGAPPVTLATGDWVELRGAGAGGSYLSGVWLRTPWTELESTHLTIVGESVQIGQLDTIGPRTRLHIGTRDSTTIPDFIRNDGQVTQFPAIDELTDQTGRATHHDPFGPCDVEIFETDHQVPHASRMFPCGGEIGRMGDLRAFDIEDGWYALAFDNDLDQNGGVTIQIGGIDVPAGVNDVIIRLDPSNVPIALLTSPSPLVEVSWSNGRLLVHSDRVWWLFERTADGWDHIELGRVSDASAAASGSETTRYTDPVSEVLDSVLGHTHRAGGAPDSNEYHTTRSDMCLVNDHLIFTLEEPQDPLPSKWHLHSATVSRTESFTPDDMTRLVADDQYSFTPTRAHAIWSTPMTASLPPTLSCTTSEVAVFIDASLWLYDTLSGSSIHWSGDPIVTAATEVHALRPNQLVIADPTGWHVLNLRAGNSDRFDPAWDGSPISKSTAPGHHPISTSTAPGHRPISKSTAPGHRPWLGHLGMLLPSASIPTWHDLEFSEFTVLTNHLTTNPTRTVHGWRPAAGFALPDFVESKVLRESAYIVDVISTDPWVATLDVDQTTSLPWDPDADRDGALDGAEVGTDHLAIRSGVAADATTHYGCVDAERELDLTKRWTMDVTRNPIERYHQLNEQCRLSEGLMPIWTPGQGAGSAVTWPFRVDDAGVHRLSFGTSSGTSVTAATIVRQTVDIVGRSVDGRAGGAFQPRPPELRQPTAFPPDAAESITSDWLADLLVVEVVDHRGIPLDVVSDDLLISIADVAAHREGGHMLRLGFSGSIDVDVRDGHRVMLVIRWAQDGIRGEVQDLTGLGMGTLSIYDFKLVTANPVARMWWGPLGGSDPWDADTDGDTVADGNDVAPLAIDIDEDALTDGQELALATSMLDRDTDGDGVFDGVEVGLTNTTSPDTCVREATTWRATQAPLSRCAGVSETGPASWHHRRVNGRSSHATFSPVSRLDGDPSTFTDPVLVDSDGDGIPDGWIDGWEYVGRLADEEMSRGVDGSGTGTLLALSTIGAYNASRWMPGEIRNGLIAIEEGEDWDLDGSTDGSTFSTGCGGWTVVPYWHLACGGVTQLDPSSADSDYDPVAAAPRPDGMPDGYEVLTSIWWADHLGSTANALDPTKYDPQTDFDLAPPAFHPWDFSTWDEGALALAELPLSTLDGAPYTAPSSYSEAILAFPVQATCTLTTSCGQATTTTFELIGSFPRGTSVAVASATALSDGYLRTTDPVTGLHRPIEFTSLNPVSGRIWEARLPEAIGLGALDTIVLLLQLPAGANSGTSLWVRTGGSETVEHRTRGAQAPTGGPTDWVDSGWAAAALIAPYVQGGEFGDGLGAYVEYIAGTLPTTVDTDGSEKERYRDQLTDYQELIGTDNGVVTELADVPIRWVTNAKAGALGLRLLEPQLEGTWFVLPDREVGGSADEYFQYAQSRTADDPYLAQNDLEPADFVPYARLDDGAWLGVSYDSPLSPPPHAGIVDWGQYLIIAHASVHWNEPETWDSELAVVHIFTSEAGPGSELGFWTSTGVDRWTLKDFHGHRHQVGLIGSPFQRDGDGDGLIDGHESTTYWTGNATVYGTWRDPGAAEFKGPWGTDPALLDDPDGDLIPAGWDPDADDDGILDGREPGWAIDLDADGLPGALDADSDSDGLLDGAEHLPHVDSDGDGVELTIELAGVRQARLTLGVNALDVDSDNDGLPDHGIDGLAWRLTPAASLDSDLNGELPAGVTELDRRVWAPELTTLDTFDGSSWSRRDLRLAGSPISGDGGAPEAFHGAWERPVSRHYTGAGGDVPTFADGVRQPWEGEDRDGVQGYGTESGDLDPTRRDSDGDHLLDGTAMFVDQTGAGAGTRPTALRFVPEGAVLEPIPTATSAILTTHWAQAGETTGPFIPRAWIPPTPWYHAATAPAWRVQGDGHDRLACADRQFSAQTRGAWQTTLAGPDMVTTGADLDLYIPETTGDAHHWGACWDHHPEFDEEGTLTGWSWLGWSDGADPDSDDDGLSDADERELYAVLPSQAAWHAWSGAGAIELAYLAGSAPRVSDTDGDGLTDDVERIAGTAADGRDSDWDGIRDDLEDTDADGTVDAGESDPLAVDTDGDGVPDGDGFDWKEPAPHASRDDSTRILFAAPGPDDTTVPAEWNRDGTMRLGDPTILDSDGDGLADGAEFIAWLYSCSNDGSCDPTDMSDAGAMLSTRDHDGDGLWDGTEVPSFAHGSMADAWSSSAQWWEYLVLDPRLTDTDGDGLTDGLEPHALTDYGEATPAPDPLQVNGHDPCSVLEYNQCTATGHDHMKTDLLAQSVDADTWLIHEVQKDQTNDVHHVSTTGALREATATNVVSLPAGVVDLHLPDIGPGDLLPIPMTVTMEDGSAAPVKVLIGSAGAEAVFIPRSTGWLSLRQFSSTTLTLDISGVPSTNDQPIWARLVRDEVLVDTRRVLVDDADFDGMKDALEAPWDLSQSDRDTDDDGLADGLELSICRAHHTRMNAGGVDRLAHLPRWLSGGMTPEEVYDHDGDALWCGLDPDSDGDGLRDGTEFGITGPVPEVAGTTGIGATDSTTTLNDTQVPHYAADADPLTRTDMLDIDTDDDGVPDGWLDLNCDLTPQASEFQLAEWSDRDRSGVDTRNPSPRLPPRSQIDTCGTENVWESTPDAWTEIDVTPATAMETFRGSEDLDGDGAVSDGELDPLDTDVDDDGLPDGPSRTFRGAILTHWRAHAATGSTLDHVLATTARLDALLAVCTGESWTPTATSSDADSPGHGTALERLDRDEDGTLNQFDTDSDGDGIADGFECGVTLDLLRGLDWLEGEGDTVEVVEELEEGFIGPSAISRTDKRTGVALNDADPGTFTDPTDADSDDDGLSDGEEDLDGDGARGARETDALDHDTDGDTLPDGLEKGRDADSLTGQLAWATDTTATAPAWVDRSGTPWRADADTLSTTDPLSIDSDADGLYDAPIGGSYGEDQNGNGRYDPPTTVSTLIAQQDPDETTHVDPVWHACWSTAKAAPSAAPAASCELDASSPDTDGDFVLDHEELAGWEVIIRSVIPVDPDDEEAESGLDAVSQGAIASLPWYADSDLDGVEDGVEKRHAANPASADSDGDGFTDSEEIDTGGITTRESDPPTVEVEKRGDGFVIRLYCTGKWSFCLDPVLERVFKVRLKVTDNAGVADTRVWLGEAGMRDDGPGTSRAPGRAVDPLAALIHIHGSGGSPLDASTASALDKGTLGIKAGDARDVHNGLPTDVWIDLDVSKKLRLDFTKLSTARSVLNGDLFDMFGEFTMYIEAADVAGNIGQGEVTFDSALNLLLTYLNSAINALADFLDAIIDAVKQLAMLFVDFVIKPLINMYLSAAALLYPFIEYFVTILEVVGYFEFQAFWDHDMTQSMFGAVLGLLRQWNLITFTIDFDSIMSWVTDSVKSLVDPILDQIPKSLPELLALLPFSSGSSDNLTSLFEDYFATGDPGNGPLLLLFMFEAVVRGALVLPKLVPSPSFLLSFLGSALIGAVISAIGSKIVDSIFEPSLATAITGRDGALDTSLSIVSIFAGPAATGFLMGEILSDGADADATHRGVVADILRHSLLMLLTTIVCLVGALTLAPLPVCIVLLIKESAYIRSSTGTGPMVAVTALGWWAFVYEITVRFTGHVNLAETSPIVNWILGVATAVIIAYLALGIASAQTALSVVKGDKVEAILGFISMILMFSTFFVKDPAWAYLIAGFAMLISGMALGKAWYDGERNGLADESLIAKILLGLMTLVDVAAIIKLSTE